MKSSLVAVSEHGLSFQNPEVLSGYDYTASETKFEWQNFSALRISALQTEQTTKSTGTWRFRLVTEPELRRQPLGCDYDRSPLAHEYLVQLECSHCISTPVVNS